MLGVNIRSRAPSLALGVAFILMSGAVMLPFFTQSDSGNASDIIFDSWINDKLEIYSGSLEPISSIDHNGDPLIASEGTRSDGGMLEWTAKIADHDSVKREYLSTPNLVDLDGKGGTEVVIASTDDVIHALDSSGGDFWSEPYTESRIDHLGEYSAVSGLDFDPPHFFSNPAAYTFDEKEGPLIFMGTMDGILCLDRYGDRKWLKGEENVYYQSTPAITDLEGDFSDPSQMEIIYGGDDINRRGWLEGYSPDGDQLFRTEVPVGSEGCLIGCGITAQDHDGDFWDGYNQIDPGPDVERDTELTLGTHDRGLRIFGRSGNTGEGNPIVVEETDGWLAGHQTDATHAIANVDDTPECEIFVGSAEGYARTWTGWGGRLYVYTPDSVKLWDFTTGTSGTSIFSSPVVADLHLSRFDPVEEHLDYEVIFGCDDGYLYVLNTETHSLMWKFYTGGRVQSSPAICNIDQDDELEIIISSDSGYVFCLDGDPSDGIDEGMKYPGDGFSHDVLWAYEMPGAAGMSSPVVGDIDNDRMLECIIGDTSGVVHCISCGGESFAGLMEWPEFHGNLNRTGYYSSSVKLGIDLHPRIFGPGDIEDKSKLAEPGETIRYDLSLTTQISGLNVNARYRVFLKILPYHDIANWTSWIEIDDSRWDPETKSIILRPYETIDFTAFVSAPYEGELIDTETFRIKANYSFDKWAMDEIQITTTVRHVLDFDLSYLKKPSADPLDPMFERKWEKMRPGSTAQFSISLANSGTLNDTYRLMLNPPPVDSGWDWFFQESGSVEMNLSIPSRIFDKFGSLSNIQLTVQIVCPPEAMKDSQIPIILSGVSVLSLDSDAGELIRSDELIIVAGLLSDLHMWFQEPIVYHNPDEWIESKLMMSNLGNSDVVVKLSMDGARLGWDIRFPESGLKLYFGQTKAITIRIRAPGDPIQYGTTVNFIFIGSIDGASHKQAEAVLTLVAKQVHGFEIRETDDRIDMVYPGENAGFGMEVVIVGNGEEVLTFTVAEENIGTEMVFLDTDGMEEAGIALDSGAYHKFTLNFTVPEDSMPGSYRIVVGISNGIEDRYIVFGLRILQLHILSIASAEGEPQFIMESTPGYSYRIMYQISNGGNGLDPAEIRALITQDNGATVTMSDEWMPTIVGISTRSDYSGKYVEMEGVSSLNLSGVSGSMYYSMSDVSLVGSHITESKFSLILDPGQTAWVHLRFHIPRSMARLSPEGLPITLIAGNSMLPNPAVMRIQLEFKYPLLRIVGGLDVTTSQDEGKYDAREGDLVTIMALVENYGDAEARDVDVQLYIDDKREKNVTIPVVRTEEGRYKAVFSWIAEAGKHTIKVVVDPDNGVLERGENPDMGMMEEREGEEVRITVKGESAFLDGGAIRAILILLPIILILASVLIGGYMIMKRKGRI